MISLISLLPVHIGCPGIVPVNQEDYCCFINLVNEHFIIMHGFFYSE